MNLIWKKVWYLNLYPLYREEEMECVGPAWQSIPQDEDLLCAQVRFDFKANSVNFLNIRLLFISIESPRGG